MNPAEARQLLITAFHRLRGTGFTLGISELLAAIQASEGGFGIQDVQALQAIARLLWCHSELQVRELEALWPAYEHVPTPPEPKQLPSMPPLPALPSQASRDTPPAEPPRSVVNPSPSAPPALEPLRSMPFKVSPALSVLRDDPADLAAYWPVSRRFMTYAWRLLRKIVADGPRDLLDLPATIECAARQGIYLAPVYRRRSRNSARLLLLLDQGGSMTPFHRFTRDLVETARDESGMAPDNVGVYYFHNVFDDFVYADTYLTQPMQVGQMYEQCTNETGLLIVSDAGAARGSGRKFERILATSQFLSALQRYSSLLAWLNPMPQSRWTSTSAQIIANRVPMFQMDEDGLSGAIDVIRGVSKR